jgi:WD40 repeat protein
VLTVAVSPDGTLLASGGRDNTVRLWDLQSGELLRTLEGHQDLVEMVAFSPDGSRVASAGWDGMVRLWETGNGREIAALPRGTRVSSVAFSPDGIRLVSSGWDRQLVFWDAQTLQVVKQYVAHSNTSYAAAFSSDGAAIASCGFDGVAKLWTVEGELLQTFTRQLNPIASSPVQAAAWSPDEEFIATAHADGSVCITRVDSAEIVQTRKLAGATGTALAFSADGKALLCGTSGGLVQSWTPSAEQPEPTLLAAHGGRIVCLALTGDGRKIVSCGSDGSLHVVDIETRRNVASLDAEAVTPAAAFDPAHGVVATAHADGRLRFWDVAADRELAGDFKLPVPPTRMAFDPTGRTLVTAAGTAGRVWSMTVARGAVTVSEQRSLNAGEGEYLALAFSPGAPGLLMGDSTGAVRVWGPSGLSGRALARRLPAPVSAIAVSPRTGTVLTAGVDGTAWLWSPDRNRRELRPLAAVPAHARGARYVAITPDGRRMLTDGYDSRVRIWDLASGEQEGDLGVPDSASALALSPDGARAAVGHYSKRVRIVHLATGHDERNYPGLPRGPYRLALSPDQTRLAAVLYEHGVKLFDLTSREADAVVSFAPDALPYTWVEFSPDGRTFATSTGDWQQKTLPGKVRLHDAQDGAVLRTFEGHTEEVKSVTFDTDGARLAATSADKTAQVWNVRTGERLAVLPHETGVFTAAFVPDGDLLITADYHGFLHVWDLRTGEHLQHVPCHTDMVGRVVLSADQSVLATASRDGLASLWELSGAGNDRRIVDARPREKKPLRPE